MYFIGLIVSGEEAFREFQVFLKTLELFHTDAVLYVGCDKYFDINKLNTNITIHISRILDKYDGKTRSDMEALGGIKYDTLFKDYTYEKATVLEWIFESESDASVYGVWFMDADIIHCCPLPDIPKSATLALSPHYIRTIDEKRYGRFNAGFLWIRDKSLLHIWREAGHRSNFYEQKALEELVPFADIYEFPENVNFGWWRMFQGIQSPPIIQSKFSIFRNEPGIGIRYNGKPLQSIHTHLGDLSHSITGEFNRWILNYTERLKKTHKTTRIWMTLIQ